MKNCFKKAYYITSFFFIIDLVLNYFDWQFSGYLTEKIIAWIWIVYTLIFLLIFWKSKYVKIYFSSIIVLIALSLIPMAIPFFAMIDFISQNGDFQEIKLNKKYRIERTQQQPLSMIRVYFYKNHFGILEKNICRPDYSEIVEEVMNLKNNENISSFDMKSIPIQNAKLVSENIDSIGIEYRIANKKKVVYHRLYNEDGY